MKQPLSFKNGITNNPSDLVCSDDCLAVEIGAEWNGNAHVAIQYPKEIDDNFPYDIAIINDFANYTHIISVHDGKLWWCDLEAGGYEGAGEMHEIDTFESSVISAEAIGNTVILNTDDGLLYLLWKDEGYVVLGSRLPEIEVKVGLTEVKKYSLDSEYSVNVSSFIVDDHGRKVVRSDCADDFKNAVVGIIAKTENKLKSDGHFPYPFFARLAYRLYDGTNAMITSPILVMPTVRYNRKIVMPSDGLALYFEPYAGDLTVDVSTDLTDWDDIITGVDVFVSDSVRGFDMDGDYGIANHSVEYYFADYVGASGNYGTYTELSVSGYDITCTQKSDNSIIKELINNSIFYKILELDKSDIGSVVNVSSKVVKNTILNLTTQLRLEHDDYYGHCEKYADSMITYNGRLQLAGIRRGFFDGFKHFVTLAPSERTAEVYVEIQSQSGMRTVKQEVEDESFAYWFYYPDPRAKNAYVIIGGSKYKLSLTQHPWLNGAYYFGALPSTNSDSLPTAEEDSTAPTLNNEPEVLANQIITSEVNNPFVYNVDGVNDVGSGRILGLTTNTQALSEGQFGQHPLIAFTDEGIWALMTNSEGLYNSVIPVSREVCSNPKSIVQTDNAIFFATKKGLMILVGSKVQCVSELLDGKDADLEPFLESNEDYLTTPLRDVLQVGKIAYDYKNQRLWIYYGSNIWTFNIKSRTFSQVHTTDYWVGHSILYPDCIVQTDSGKLLSLLKTDNINDDLNDYDARLITRPLKFGDALSYKTLFRIDHLWLGEGDFTLKLWGSDDLKQWERLGALHGRPWRYYTFRLDFMGMLATDTYHGMVVECQPRHANRMHTEQEPE